MAANDYQVGPVQEEEIEALWSILFQSLHRFMPPNWPELLGPERFRVVRHNGTPVGGLALVKMGQWFGGARVPTAGITAVGVSPEYRGRGAASVLMLKALEEAHCLGIPISTLYPSTATFYRMMGYERAGLKTVYQMPVKTIDAREKGLDVIPVGTSEYEEIYHAYEVRARGTSGNLDRPAFLWDALIGAEGRGIHRYLITNEGRTEGYVVFQQARGANHIRVRDLALLTGAAAARLLKFFADHRSIIETVSWNGPPNDPLAFANNEEEVEQARIADWMIRIVDVEAALTARGYPPELDMELHFDVEDDLLTRNSGRYLLHVSNGQGSVTRGGRGEITTGVRGLAAMYTGHMTLSELKVFGMLDGPDAQLERASLVFSGPRPWLAEQF